MDLQVEYKEALKLQQDGKPVEALKAYGKITKENPNIPEVYFQVGAIEMNRFRLTDAVANFERAVELKPKEPRLWGAYINALVIFGDKDREKSALKFAKQHLNEHQIRQIRDVLNGRDKKPSFVGLTKAQIDELTNLVNAGKSADVAAKCNMLLKKLPRHPFLIHLLANAYVLLDDQKRAKELFEANIKNNPNYFDTHFQFARALSHWEEHEKAVRLFIRAKQIKPNDTTSSMLLASELLALKLYHDVERLLQPALLQKEHKKSANILIAKALGEQENYNEALPYLLAAQRLGEDGFDLHASLASTFQNLDRTDEALSSLKKMEKLRPGNKKVFMKIGQVAQNKGDFETARSYFRKVLEIDPKMASALNGISRSEKISPDEDVVSKVVDLFENNELEESHYTQAGFALFKIFSDAKDHKRAFPYLKAANDLTQEKHPFKIRDNSEGVAKIIERHKTVFESDFDFHPNPKHHPIFVAGMPRSGTTLIEQIISSHPEVCGAGEIGAGTKNVNELSNSFVNSPKGQHQQRIDRLDTANKIWQDLEVYSNGEKYITDKSINTWTAVGGVKKLLPNSKIIVLRRDPMDNLFSIYKNSFAEGSHAYSTSLETLAHQYEYFRMMVEAWKKELGDDILYEVYYDKLVENQEEESRKLIDAAGLEWDDACLEPQNNNRTVKTLSVYQVRQPVYKSSQKSWEKFKDELEPLRKMLDDRGLLD